VIESAQTNLLRLIQAIVYLVSAGALFLFMAWSLALVLYGVVPHPLLLCAFFAAVAFVVAAVVSFSSPGRGRVIALLACAASFPLWIVWIIGVVPAHDVIFLLPIPHLLVVAYLLVLGFVLFWPYPFRLSIALIVLVCCTGVVVGWRTYTDRVASGEYDRPGVACFRWTPDASREAVVLRDPLNWINERVRVALSAAKISGTLQSSGAWGDQSSPSRMIVLLKDRPASGTRLYCPRHGIIVIYAFDGKNWIKAPADAPTYPSFFTIEESDGRIMLYENTAGGKAGTQVLQ
jgi:hypothetical protein